MRFKFVFSYLLFALVTFSQRVELKTIDPIMCFNDNNGELTVIDDTNWIQTYSVRGKLISKSRILEKAVSITELKEEFIPVFMHKKLHFVERGCGRVLRFHQGVLERIDHSFSHRNQYSALVISFRDTLYCIGGYGFFTVKDQVTYFDEGLGQWFLKNNSFKIKQQILNPMHFMDEDGITVYGGSKYEDFIVRNTGSKVEKKVLRFNLSRRDWENVGILNDGLIPHLKDEIFVGSNTYVTVNSIALFYPKRNRVFLLRDYKNVVKLYAFKNRVIENKMIRISYSVYNNILFFHDFDSFVLKNKAAEIPFYKKTTDKTSLRGGKTILLLGSLIVILLCIYFIFRKLKKSGNLINVPNDLMSLLSVWVEHGNYIIELSDINKLVAYDNPELETLKKRREGLLKRLKTYLMENHRFEEDEVYTTELSTRDKRIKLFKLHPKVVKWYNKVK